jgi:hypothetical protein
MTTWREMSKLGRMLFAQSERDAQIVAVKAAMNAWHYEKRLVAPPVGVSANRWRAMVAHSIMVNGCFDSPSYED